MSDEDKKFIATIFAAARKCGIGARADFVMGRFEWFDPLTGGSVRLQTPNPNKEDMLHFAATALRDYLSIQQKADAAK